MSGRGLESRKDVGVSSDQKFSRRARISHRVKSVEKVSKS
jgi:hypothetical protein